MYVFEICNLGSFNIIIYKLLAVDLKQSQANNTHLLSSLLRWLLQNTKNYLTKTSPKQVKMV